MDIEERIIRLLQGRRGSRVSGCPAGAIVLAHDLTPSQTVALDRRQVGGFVTEEGGHTSHTAILAKNLGIPAVVGAGGLLKHVADGDQVIVDGGAGVVVLRPDRKTVVAYEERRQSFADFEERLVTEYRDRPAETVDGCRVRLLGNIEFPAEIETALAFGAGGIGLYRTEYLFLAGRSLPDEEAQVEAYCEAIELLGDRPLVIRTMDLGADKKVPGLATLGDEFNPFLGCRSIRLCFREPEMFQTQLRAILRAARAGDVRIMFPMISSLSELKEARGHLEAAKEQLSSAGIPHQPEVPVGIMIEVPSAVLIADHLAEEADFFSIGTNDLIQYTLAVDRVNQSVADLYQPTHPAILRMVSRLLEVAAESEIPVSVCGEMSGNVAFAVLLAGLGLREFSVSPASIPEIKKVIRSISIKEAREVASQALAIRDGQETADYLASLAREIIPELFGEVPVAGASS
jgi:phosphotransferase system enzyme I (PtsI)